MKICASKEVTQRDYEGPWPSLLTGRTYELSGCSVRGTVSHFT